MPGVVPLLPLPAVEPGLMPACAGPAVTAALLVLLLPLLPGLLLPHAASGGPELWPVSMLCRAGLELPVAGQAGQAAHPAVVQRRLAEVARVRGSAGMAAASNTSHTCKKVFRTHLSLQHALAAKVTHPQVRNNTLSLKPCLSCSPAWQAPS